MFKKMLVATAILASSSVAFANAGVPYAGASIGVNDTQMNVKDAGSTFNVGGRNANFTLFAGYGALVNPMFYLGGEAFVNSTAGNFDAVNAPAIGTVTYDTRYTYGVSLIPGLMLSDHVMAYGRVGVARASFNVKAPGANDDESVTGAQAGLGLQTSVTQNLDLRGEYVYSSYRSFTTGGVKTSPSSDQFNVGLVYKFE